jgi:murein DD-endopeptidase MepM/ murein hydrolase activator NlpD
MIKNNVYALTRSWNAFWKEFFAFLHYFFFSYLKHRIIIFSRHFEKNKNLLVKFFIMKRGRYNRPFLHFTTMGVLGIGVLVAPYLADTYPIFSSSASQALLASNEEATKQSIIVGENVFQTAISEKPRDKVITYTVQKGDTISTIAQKFAISTDTIKWANDLSSDDLTVGDELKILPVTGISHKVASGETVYSIAKKYDTEAQKIVDFPFNDFANPEKFTLIAGQMIVVPDGIEPQVPAAQRSNLKREVYIAQGPASVSPGGFTWPVRGGISQFASWYHMALDITADVGTPIVAGQNGRVASVSLGSWDGGYGNNVWVENGDGFATHYAHMSTVAVGAGQNVTAGSTVIGYVGMSGRTTGPHLHFEVRKNGALVNPLSYLQ